MAEITTNEIKEYLLRIQGQKTSLRDLRSEFQILPGTKSFDAIRNIMFKLIDQKIVRPTAKGEYKVIRQVQPIRVFGSQRRPPISINFPKDFDSEIEMCFAEDLIIREGDLILLSGMSNYGKTALCLHFAGENIDKEPVLMGNEYTTLDNAPSSRFLHRLDAMNWVQWYNDDGDNFVLLPVRGDYAEHIVKDKINIIDWINIDTGEHYLIGSLMESIKRELGKGVAIIAIQKAEGAVAGRGGQFTKDFADVEILLDKMQNSDEVLLSLGKVKESKRTVMGRTFAYAIVGGVKIINFREVVKCHSCYGKGWVKSGNSSKPCDNCNKTGFLDK